MSNTKPSVNYFGYDKKKKKTKGGKPSQQQFHGSGSLPSINKPDANGKLQIKGKICYRCGKSRHQPDQNCCAINAICNKCGKKGHYAVICQKGKGFPHSSGSAHIVESSSGSSTSQTEPDLYTKHGQPIYAQSHMLQTMSTKSQKNSREVQMTVGIPNQTPLQGYQSKGIA